MNSTVLVLLAFVALCSAHVHIMEPHDETVNVATDGTIKIKCESFADKDIKWLFNHKPLVAGAGSKVAIVDSHETHTEKHTGHDDKDEHDHKTDDDIDKLLHAAHDGHEDDHEDGGHSHSHDDDHDHDHEGSHNPTGEHAKHHRVSTLTISKATESDAGTYSCYEHDDEDEHDEIDVTVNNKWGAERISLEHESTDHVHLGGTIALVCNYYGTKASAQIVWKKGGVAVPSDFDTKQLTKPYGAKSLLHKDKAALTDQGEYTCTVDALSDNVKVAVATRSTSSSGALVPTACPLALAVIFATVKFWF